MYPGHTNLVWNGLRWILGISVQLQRVGYIFPLMNGDSETIKHPWPTFITGGDISKDGTLIILRSYNGKLGVYNII